jgi:putative ABC transport system ATP-binding protein
MDTAAKRTIVDIRNVHKSYLSGRVERKVLTGANLTIAEGEFVVVFGPSGCGKTTLLNIIGGLDRATSGEVWVDGVDLSKVKASDLSQIRREKIGFVFQFFNLISNLTAAENVELGLEAAGRRGDGVRKLSLSYLEKVGLLGEADTFTEHLSGGEQQRVAIARALVKGPRLVLADEPTGNLDEENAMRIAEVMMSLHRDIKSTFIVVTHNQSLAQIADKVYYLSRGRLMGA